MLGGRSEMMDEDGSIVDKSDSQIFTESLPCELLI